MALSHTQVRDAFVVKLDRVPTAEELDRFKAGNQADLDAYIARGGREVPAQQVSAPQIQQPSVSTSTAVKAPIVTQADQTIPDGFVRISGAEFPTREAQQKAFTDIRQVGDIGKAGSFLIGKAIPEERREGALIKLPASSTVFIVEDGKLRPFKSEAAFKERGFSFDQVKTVRELPNIPSGSMIEIGGSKPSDTTKFVDGVKSPQEDLIAHLIDTDPFIRQQFKDSPELKDLFDQLPTEQKLVNLELVRNLAKQIEAGKVINPDIDITPSQTAKFLEQASSEIDPYFSEQIAQTKLDVTTSLQRMQQDFERGLSQAGEPFSRALEAQSESEAQAGTAFSSGRARREGALVTEQQQAIDAAQRDLGRAAEDIASAGERRIGSEAFSGIQIPEVASGIAGTKGISTGTARRLFQPQGSLLGTLQKERETARRVRASELEGAFRSGRTLDFS